jgi:glutamate synthase (NADPH/NADH) large chain
MAVFSQKPRSLYDCFRQCFAQVTNPAIDSLRERLVMSLQTNIGQVGNLHCPQQQFAMRLTVDSPVLLPHQFRQLAAHTSNELPTAKFDLLYDIKLSLQEALKHLVESVEKAVVKGKIILYLSDRLLTIGQRSIHPLLACGAITQRLIELRLQGQACLIIETGFARDPHQFACLLAYGATAIFPYLSYQLAQEIVETSQTLSCKETAVLNYRQGINKGILKILSKMGIATVNSYRGSQLFEIMGLDQAIIQYCFKGSVCRISGLSFEDLESPIYTHVGSTLSLPNKGLYVYSEFGEYHDYNPSIIVNLLQATRNNDQTAFEAFAQSVNNRGIKSVRDLWTLCSSRSAIAIAQVEAGSEIIKRFETAAMSLGALSPEAHQALALAMNHMGGRSNSGEGGEDPLRHDTQYTSKIKQIASGRFGVTSEYLINADVIQIKIAQGAKPGEGGQLPGKKVNHLIAKLRYCKKGVTLISPPPHHDIYSIEDLAQLIFDLKQVNSQALVSVKLVAGTGVGTIAVGVAKAYADSITVSGYDGGTGASPLSAIKHAGLPWEFGLLEVHQALQANDLRHKVRLCVEGGLKTGVDVIKAAALGAEEFGFGTAPLIALGCKYLRICHLNNCATGVATQNQHLRDSFYQGKPGQVINYFKWLVGDVRKRLAELGFERLDDIVGRTELLSLLPVAHQYDMQLALSPASTQNKPRFFQLKNNQPFDLAQFAAQLLQDCIALLESGERRVLRYPIKNLHRSIGANISGEITRRFGMNNQQLAPLKLQFIGTAGQSFGAWLCQGLKIELIGDANDYVGKGMNGGKIVIRHHPECRLSSDGRVIAGNTCLYGATGGEIYLAGSAGERFAIRNSGAVAVVEGVGDHGCEYMTGGLVTVLGETGINFAAGMTGGRAYVYDAKGKFAKRYNPELVTIQTLDAKGMQPFREEFYQQLLAHHQETGSELAKQLLENFKLIVKKIWTINPK